MLTSYNLVDYIDTSIASVVNQKMPCEWELLIGDDGSNDGTVDKIKAWIEKYPENIKLFQIPRDSSTVKVGSRAAKNRAYLLENASGDYLHYLDGDDCWLGDEKLSCQFELLQNPDYTDCSCCAHNTEAFVFSSQRKFLMAKESIPARKFSVNEYWPKIYFHTNTILFRKECRELLLNPLYRDYLNDNFITFLILQYGKMAYLNKIWCRYNMTGEGLWTGHSHVYGDFRNMQLVDLCINVRPEIKNIIIFRQRITILNIMHHYKTKNYTEIIPLLENLEPNVFYYTLLLSKKNSMSISEWSSKIAIFMKAFVFYWGNRAMGLIRKIHIR